MLTLCATFVLRRKGVLSMSKLAPTYKFLDLSDYGRPLGKRFAFQLKNTRFTPVHVTLLFGVAGLIAVYCILHEHFLTAGFFIILKSILDAADGELSRIKNTPSYFGRYLDSVFDLVLNFLFLMSVWYITESSVWLTFLAFLGIQLQGTLYNFYYVILRNNSVGGDATSKIFEDTPPRALAGETQKKVNTIFRIYKMTYSVFDKTIYWLDKNASNVKVFPKWFMTMISVYGLGFQLLIIACMLPLQLKEFIIPFFIIYTIFITIFISIRKMYIQ